MFEVLREHGTPRGPARVRGRLYVVDWYPGLVLDASAGWVIGEVWTSLSAEAWVVLDFYEGCSAEDPQPHEFMRREATVEAAEGELRAELYEFKRAVDKLEQVPGGDWLERTDMQA